MDFTTLINTRIMPDVSSGSDESIIIYRDMSGDWHGDHTQNQYGEEFDWVDDVREDNPFAFTIKGSDLSGGGFLSVYEKLFLEKLRMEYDFFYEDGTTGEYYTLLSFVEDNIQDIPQEVTGYLIELEKPFTVLNEMIPPEIRTALNVNFPDEEIQDKLIDYIEGQVADRLNNRKKGITLTAIDGSQTIEVNNYAYSVLQSQHINGRHITLSENPNAEHRYMVCEDWKNPQGVNENVYTGLTNEYLEALEKYTGTVKYYVDCAVSTRDNRKNLYGVEFDILTGKDCLPDGMNGDLKGKLLIISRAALPPEMQSADYQLQICTGGGGALGKPVGNAVFCKDLFFDKESRFERSDVLGAADPAKLPVWAEKKIAYMESLNEPGVFEYGGHHFKPYRDFRKNEVTKQLEGDSRPWKKDVQYEMRNMSSDQELGFARNVPWSKLNFSGDGFIIAAHGNEADIYKCVENGRLYVPYANELFQYKEPKQRTKTEKPSLAGRIEKGKEKVRESDKNKDKPDKPKKFNKGVDD